MTKHGFRRWIPPAQATLIYRSCVNPSTKAEETTSDVNRRKLNFNLGSPSKEIYE